MNKANKFFSIIFTITFLHAVGEAGAIFLLIAPGAGAAGTGEAQVAKADDAYASYYNPAGLGFLSGSEAAGMHVNWLPNLADDIYYDFLTYRKQIDGIGSFGAHLIFLNLGSQVQTDAEGNELGNFNSNMWAITTSLGTSLNKTSSIGVGFKIIQQNLGPGAGAEANEGKSTDFLFDLGYLKKFSFGNLGVSVTNIGPKIWFQDQTQADPAPTNMRMGVFSNLYDDGFNKINFMMDANKLLVSRYQQMDWNGDGIISGDDEQEHDDPWYTAIFTSWLDDWYYGGDYNKDDDLRIGGYNWYDCGGGLCADDEAWDPSLGDGNIDEDELHPTLDENGDFLSFNDPDYGYYGQCTSDTSPEDCIEKGSGDNRSFTTELEEMVYNFGAEYWYTDNFVIRGGYIYDKEGKIKNPTFGAGIRFAQYGFDFGYTAGEQGHPRANTMFFSVNINL